MHFSRQRPRSFIRSQTWGQAWGFWTWNRNLRRCLSGGLTKQIRIIKGNPGNPSSVLGGKNSVWRREDVAAAIATNNKKSGILGRIALRETKRSGGVSARGIH